MLGISVFLLDLVKTRPRFTDPLYPLPNQLNILPKSTAIEALVYAPSFSIFLPRPRKLVLGDTRGKFSVSKVGELVREAIARLRLKLLDLTNRNRLLNFKFSETSRKSIRVVDELPDALYARLTENTSVSGRLYFAALPEPPPDLLAPAVDLAVDASGDPSVRETSVVAQPEPARKGWGRSRRAGPHTRIDAAKWAIEQGIDPSYELPKPDDFQKQAKHGDNEIQTMLFPDALEKRLGNVREDANLAWQETGVKTLYAAFGFLEWYESNDSEQPRHSPLFLLPVEIDRELRANRYRYFIEIAEESEPTINVSLQERLKRDFGLALPTLDEDETPESYMKRVESAIGSQKRWTLRRFVVVGHFSFARLVMYQDLAPEQWNRLEENPLIASLLAGDKEGEDSTYAVDFDVDEEEVEKHVPALITDADSSQFSAIVDAMQGRSFALKGPPGTGKSQTITNLIAAALSAGKTVLFVAEKQAALQVVSKRLRAANLGPFLLELHSTKSQKKALLDGFEERLKFKRLTVDDSLERCLAALRKTRIQLKTYVDLMNTGVGESGITLHTLYWRDQRLRHEFTDQERHLATQAELPSADLLTSHNHAEHQLLVGRFVQAHKAAASIGETIEKHPWYGLSSPGHGIDVFDECYSKISAWATALARLEKAVARSRELFGCDLPAAVAPLTEICLALATLPTLTPDLRTDALSLIRNDNDVHELSRFLMATRRINSARGALETLFLDMDVALSREAALQLNAASLIKASRICGLDGASLRDLPQAVSLKEREIEQVISSLTILSQFADAVGLDRNKIPAWELQVVSAIRYLQTVPAVVLAARSQGLYAPEARTALERAGREAADLQRACNALESSFSLTFSEEPAVIREAAAVLQDTSPLFRLFSSKYRAARKLSRRITKGPWLGAAAEAARLTMVADVLRKRHSFEGQAGLRQLAGSAFAGLDTPFDTLQGVVDYWEAVRKLWPSLDTVRAPIQTLLLRAPTGLLSDVVATFDDKALSGVDGLSRSFSEAPDTNLFIASSEIKSALNEVRASAEECRKLGVSIDRPIEDIESGLSLLDELQAALELRGQSPFAACASGADPLQSAESVAAIEATLAVGTQILLAPLPIELKRRLLSRNAVAAVDAAKRYGRLIMEGIWLSEKPRDEMVRDKGLNLKEWFGDREASAEEISSQRLRAETALTLNRDAANDWSIYCELKRQLSKGGLDFVWRTANGGQLRLDKLTAFYEFAYVRGLLNATMRAVPHLPIWTGDHLESLRKRLVQLDLEYLSVGHKHVVGTLSSTVVPVGISQGAINAKSERSLIEHEIGKQRRHISIRELMKRAPNAARALKPCFMMSPASVAQFLPPGQQAFDLVIIDEASQMRPEDALGAIARGRQAIIVGDPMQLPPSTFFYSNSDEEETASEEEIDIDTESVLDMAISSYRPFRELRWHYRSRHHSLIAFSNREFYRDNLIVFPSPKEESGDLGVQTVFVEDGLYLSSLNLVEADQVVKTVSDLMRRYPSRSLGVVAINQPQKEHLNEQFDRLFAEDADLEDYRSKWAGTLEEFFIKNLENVQGDERDTIVISTVYGRTAPGRPVMQRFGPINSKAGHRRLNVLFTRAKERVVLVTSMRPEDITPQAGSSRGLLAFKAYLEYARSGRLDAGAITGASFDSPFEEEVAEVLERFGYKVEPQVGVAGYFIDLGVRHTQHHDHFILGIECDGASYHSAKSARDRDRLRQSVLEGLGWKLYRIWSTDWFHAREREMKRLSEHLRLVEGMHSVNH
jgi:very-short-patch-repair endonuclease